MNQIINQAKKIDICGCDQSKDLESQLDGFMKLNFDLSAQLQTANLNLDSLIESSKELIDENIKIIKQRDTLVSEIGRGTLS